VIETKWRAPRGFENHQKKEQKIKCVETTQVDEDEINERITSKPFVEND